MREDGALLIDINKYVVFKREEYAESDEIEPLEDCVVIRLQDIFAAPALYTYANTIRSSIEIVEALIPNADEDIVMRLHELADFFMDMAAKAEAISNKIPD